MPLSKPLSEALPEAPTELPSNAPGGTRALAQAAEVAQWSVMLLGWLWLGEQGQRFGGSVAGGVWAVALWWALRIVCRGHAVALQAAPVWLAGLGLLTACAVWWPSGVLLPGMLAPGAAPLGLLALAVLWALWSALIESRAQRSSFPAGSLVWQPLLAACVALWVWQLPAAVARPLALSGTLAVCAALLYARERRARGPVLRCKSQRESWAHVLAPSAMGLMMGSLWLAEGTCAGLALSTEQRVWGHVALMAGLPTAVAWGFSQRRSGWAWASPSTTLTMGLLLAGAMAMVVAVTTGGGLASLASLAGALGMLATSLAWALHCSRSRPLATASNASGEPGTLPRGALRAVALLAGPGLLWWVGIISPTQGPAAIQIALAGLGGLAAVWLMASLARRSWPHKVGSIVSP